MKRRLLPVLLLSWAFLSARAQEVEEAPLEPGEEEVSPPPLVPKPLDKSGMALIPEGAFTMGAPEGKSFKDAQPGHKVYLGAYYIDIHETTQAQFLAFCEANGRTMPQQVQVSPDLPVVLVEWEEARDYCAWEGKRLPTEAEWEKAAQGGNGSTFCSGSDPKSLGDCAWYEGNWKGYYSRGLRPVMRKKPNAYGLYDMLGNASEMVLDWYDPAFYALGPARNPVNPVESGSRVHRGGAFNTPAKFTRTYAREPLRPEARLSNTGFRCAAEAN